MIAEHEEACTRFVASGAAPYLKQILRFAPYTLKVLGFFVRPAPSLKQILRFAL